MYNLVSMPPSNEVLINDGSSLILFLFSMTGLSGEGVWLHASSV